MNRSRHKLTLWMLALCLVLTVVISPALAKTQASSGGTSSPDTTKKSKKKSKKDKASADDTVAAAAAAPASTSNMAAPKKATKAAASGAASSPEITAAQSSGKVWVNLESGVYHKGGRWYGKTKNGKFMTEAEAKAAGYKQSQKD